MEAARDLGRVDPWQESLERSLARRARRPSVADTGDRRRSRAATTGRPRRPRLTNQPKLLAVGSWGVLALTVVMVTVGGLVDGRGAQASATASRARPAHTHFTAISPAAGHRGLGSAPVGAGPTCRPVPKATGYVNPVAGDVLISERIDQGVDYAGSGTLTAIGPGRITYVGTGETGWPGAFVEYRLLSGPDTGCFVYYAEGITPTSGLRPGQQVRAGQVLANIIPGWATGIELGWGAGVNTKTYAEKTGKWDPTDDADNVASAAGKNFSALITALGGPPGRVEG